MLSRTKGTSAAAPRRTPLNHALAASATAMILLLGQHASIVDGQEEQQQVRVRNVQDTDTTNTIAPKSGDINLWTCTPNEDSQFEIQLMDMSENMLNETGADDIDKSLAEAFTLAAKRWQKVIVGDVTPSFGNAGMVDDWFGGQFAPRFYNGAVDDLVIGFAITDIDGPGGTLGAAGPVFTRTNRFTGETMAPVSGIMQFDRVDARNMPIEDFKAVVLHEMGHVLGLVGTTTNRCSRSCNPNNSFQQVGYECPFANAEYESLIAGLTAQDPLKLENNGGAGTACGHWEENSFRAPGTSELMTGFFEAGLFQPLSLVTVAALDDLGGAYQVDYCGADVWPATAETQQKFDVYVTTQTMDTEGMMESRSPMWTVDEDGNSEEIPTSHGGVSSSPTTPNGGPSSSGVAVQMGAGNAIAAHAIVMGVSHMLLGSP